MLVKKQNPFDLVSNEEILFSTIWLFSHFFVSILFPADCLEILFSKIFEKAQSIPNPKHMETGGGGDVIIRVRCLTWCDVAKADNIYHLMGVGGTG